MEPRGETRRRSAGNGNQGPAGDAAGTVNGKNYGNTLEDTF